MDGTLLGPEGRVSERNRAALLRAERAGVEIVIATGRRHAYAMRVMRDVGLRGASAVVSSNGTVIRTIGSELVHRVHMPLETARWLCEAVDAFRDTLVLTFDTVEPDGEDRMGALVCEETAALDDSIGAWMRANAPYLLRVDRMEQALRVPPRAAAGGVAVAVADEDAETAPGAEGLGLPIQAMLCGTMERMEAAEALLRQHPMVAGVGEAEFPGCEIVLHRTAYPARDLSILDILPAGCSKASALAHLAALRGCTLREVLAIGDNWNDVSMLEAAGQAVLMGNAPDELKTVARELGWTVGRTNEEDGVAEAVEAVLARADVS